MRILLLTHAFNSLSQRLAAELGRRGHEISVEFDIADSVNEEAVALFVPDLIIAPYLRRAIPHSIWSRQVCLVVHPGIPGDRGPSALDWAIEEGQREWGVTVLQAQAEMDAGPVWAYETFPMRQAKKSSIYRNEVTQAATKAVLRSLEHFESRVFVPQARSALPPKGGGTRPLMQQSDRCLDWQHDDTAKVLRKIRAADGFPGVIDELFGTPCRLFDAWPEAALRGTAGTVIARRETALLRATTDGAVWIGHVKRENSIKLPAALAFEQEAANLPQRPLSTWWRAPAATWQDISYEEEENVGILHFEFYNGAMSTVQCSRLHAALKWAKQRPTRILLMMGGTDYWSNGIHLNVIEAASLAQGSAAEESWRNIIAMDDLTLELINTEHQITVAAMGGNSGAGGCFLARACDQVWAREATVLNPHYKNMGNLYGSEYWTYLLPARVGEEGAQAIMRRRQPLTARQALEIGFIDACILGDVLAFRRDVLRRAKSLAADPDFAGIIAAKLETRRQDESIKPLSAYRDMELSHMRRNFFGFDPSYHVARHHFVYKSPASWTPRHLARHRDLDWVIP